MKTPLYWDRDVLAVVVSPGLAWDRAYCCSHFSGDAHTSRYNTWF